MKQIDGICIQFKKALKSIQIYGTNENGEDMRILQSILCAGLYPNVVRVKLPSTKYKSNIKGNVEKGIDSKEIKFYEKDPGGRIFLHPSSCLYTENRYGCPYAMFLQKMETSKLYMFDCCVARPYALLLFGGKLNVNHLKSFLTIDEFVTFDCTSRVAVLIEGLRSRLDDLLKEIYEDPADKSFEHSPVVTAMMKLIRSDGYATKLFDEKKDL